jgi:hypothetical protein
LWVINRTGEDVFSVVNELKVIFGKCPGSQSVPNDANGHTPMWKKKSIFWEPPYWKFLEVRSAIDVMHMTADDSQVEKINYSTFQNIKGCRTHEEVKALVSKFCVFGV